MLTYCTNIHPAESWNDIFANVRRYVPLIKEKVSPRKSFPLGLRLSGRAAEEINIQTIEYFLNWCNDKDIFVSTINGFPYGTFHHVPIKETVYLPDWRDPERLRYTKQLANLLAVWLPENRKGSISTVPVGFRDSIGFEDQTLVKAHLLQALEFLDHLAQTTGKDIKLAIEPEPGCVIETITEFVDFFNELALPQSLKHFLAICYDCCHQALQFESPEHSLKLLAENDINIGHVQVSSALRLEHPDLQRLRRFVEPCYLHQTVGLRKNGSLLRYNDLDIALAEAPKDILEWRVHFHVPVFIDRLRDCASTQSFLIEILPLFDKDIPMEVETYTWSVLPPDLQALPLTDSIVREIKWVKAHRYYFDQKNTDDIQ